jgi:hypothetical protein
MDPPAMHRTGLNVLNESCQDPIDDLKQLRLRVQRINPLVAVEQIIPDPVGNQEQSKHDVVQVMGFADQSAANGHLALGVSHQEPIECIFDVAIVDVASPEKLNEFSVSATIKTARLVRMIDSLSDGTNRGHPATGNRLEQVPDEREAHDWAKLVIVQLCPLSEVSVDPSKRVEVSEVFRGHCSLLFPA